MLHMFHIMFIIMLSLYVMNVWGLGEGGSYVCPSAL